MSLDEIMAEIEVEELYESAPQCSCCCSSHGGGKARYE